MSGFSLLADENVEQDSLDSPVFVTREWLD